MYLLVGQPVFPVHFFNQEHVTYLIEISQQDHFLIKGTKLAPFSNLVHADIIRKICSVDQVFNCSNEEYQL